MVLQNVQSANAFFCCSPEQNRNLQQSPEHMQGSMSVWESLLGNEFLTMLLWSKLKHLNIFLDGFSFLSDVHSPSVKSSIFDHILRRHLFTQLHHQVKISCCTVLLFMAK